MIGCTHRDRISTVAANIPHIRASHDERCRPHGFFYMPRGVMVRQSGPFEPLPIVRGREKLRRQRAASEPFAGLGQSAFLGTSAELHVAIPIMSLHGAVREDLKSVV